MSAFKAATCGRSAFTSAGKKGETKLQPRSRWNDFPRAFIFYVRALEINWLRLASIQPEGRLPSAADRQSLWDKSGRSPFGRRWNLLDLMEVQSGCCGEIYVTTAGTPVSCPDRPVKATCCATGAAVCSEESCWASRSRLVALVAWCIFCTFSPAANCWRQGKLHLNCNKWAFNKERGIRDAAACFYRTSISTVVHAARVRRTSLLFKIAASLKSEVS